MDAIAFFRREQVVQVGYHECVKEGRSKVVRHSTRFRFTMFPGRVSSLYRAILGRVKLRTKYASASSLLFICRGACTNVL